MPIYEYECLACCHRFEALRPLNSDPDGCPECGGKIARRPSIPSDYAGGGFSTRKPSMNGPIVRSESGQLARRVSQTNLEDLEKGVRVDSKGRPKMTPTTPSPPFRSRTGVRE